MARGVVRGGCLAMKFVKNNEKESRFSFVISGKNLKKATDRNLLKRRAREIIRKKIPQIKRGHDILFIFSAKAKQLGYTVLEEELLSALERAGLIS